MDKKSMLDMVSSIFFANLGKGHPMAEDFIEKYKTEIENIESIQTLEGKQKFSAVLNAAAKEVTTLK